MAQSLFEEIGFDKVFEIMGDATAKAAGKADQLGLPHAEQLNGKWVFRYPDGSTTPFLIDTDRRVVYEHIISPIQITIPASNGKVVKRHA